MRRTPMKRTAWPRNAVDRQTHARKLEPNQPLALVEPAQAAIKTIVKSTAVMAKIGDLVDTKFPKAKAHRNPALLEMARGRHCLLRVPGVCRGGTETTVAAHSNWACHGGKGGARKADDEYSVWGCSACHIGWLDQGPAPKSVKQSVFMRAHADQVLEWIRIARDQSEVQRFRLAAQWALDQLNADMGPKWVIG